MRNTYFAQRDAATEAVLSMMDRIAQAPVDSYDAFNACVYADFSLVRSLHDLIAFHGSMHDWAEPSKNVTSSRLNSSIPETPYTIDARATRVHYTNTDSEVLTASISIRAGLFAQMLLRDKRWQLEIGGAEHTVATLHVRDKARTRIGRQIWESQPWLRRGTARQDGDVRVINELAHFKGMIVDASTALLAACGVRVVADDFSLSQSPHALGVRLATYP